MNIYIYNADMWCEECGEAICIRITEEGHAPARPDDEWTYNSDEFPKGPIENGGGEADCPQHCGAGAECFNAIELSDGSKIGALLENELTLDGRDYVQNTVKEGGDVAELWAEYYSDYL